MDVTVEVSRRGGGGGGDGCVRREGIMSCHVNITVTVIKKWRNLKREATYIYVEISFFQRGLHKRVDVLIDYIPKYYFY